MELTIWQNNGTGLGGVRKTNFEIRLCREQVPGLVGGVWEILHGVCHSSSFLLST